MYTIQIYHLNVFFKTRQFTFFMEIKNVDSLTAIDDFLRNQIWPLFKGRNPLFPQSDFGGFFSRILKTCSSSIGAKNQPATNKFPVKT